MLWLWLQGLLWWLWLATVWRILGIAASAFSVVVRGETGSQDCGWRWLLVLGVVLMLVSLGMQRGLWGLCETLWGLLWRRSEASDAVAARGEKS